MCEERYLSSGVNDDIHSDLHENDILYCTITFHCLQLTKPLTQYYVDVSNVDRFVFPRVLTVQVDTVENVHSKCVDSTQQHDGILQWMRGECEQRGEGGRGGQRGEKGRGGRR